MSRPARVPVRVLLVDDDALVRAGLRMMLGGRDDLVVVAEVADGAEVREALDRHPVDVVLMDLRMPRLDGVVATAQVRARRDPPEVVALTTFDSDAEVLGALRAGAAGFLLKDTPPAEIVDAVLRVAAGEPIVSPSVTRRLIEAAVERDRVADEARQRLDRLSDREREVVRALGQGLTNGEIAELMHVSVATVKAHVSHVLEALGMTNRTQVALLAHDAGLV
ncbi:response regulator transcription factor [Actinotalea ferrariae]|uniref:response regulator n=1 Tax=Actinotalea ferrariae TaxID=1386098 RepID=UPI001C8C2629|nr:response regulator transcription factor [Actinotalea ferrariae]MBX9245309.1 response regulator transcription factor [Actinotalea ferrariae]